MDSRWRNLLILLVIIVVGYFGYQFMFSGSSFTDLDAQIKASWIEAGYDLENFGATEAEPSQASLDEMKGTLSGLKANYSADGVESEYIGLHLILADVYSETLKTEEAKTAFYSAEDPCNALDSAREIADFTANANGKMTQLASMAEAFKNKYANDYALSGFGGIIESYSAEDSSENLQETNSALAELEAECLA